MKPLDLARPRELREILGDALRIFGQHAGVFLSLTLLVVTPAVLLVDGVWGRALIDGPDGKPPTGSQVVSLFLNAFVLPTLVTAMILRAVDGLGRGEAPTVGGVLRAAAPVLPAVLLVVALGAIGVALGLIALIVPGVWIAVRWYFGAQAVVLEGHRGRAALRRSAELVDGQWWRVFGILLVSGLVFGLLAAIVQSVLAGGGTTLYVVGLILGQALALALGALAGTLLFFDLRARHGERSPTVAGS